MTEEVRAERDVCPYKGMVTEEVRDDRGVRADRDVCPYKGRVMIVFRHKKRPAAISSGSIYLVGFVSQIIDLDFATSDLLKLAFAC